MAGLIPKLLLLWRASPRPHSHAGHAAGPRLSEEDGWLIVEIMIGALVLVLGALAIYSGLDGASKTSGRNRNRSVASYLAQQDQERMRTMDATALSNYSRTVTITVAGVPYTVISNSTYVSDSSGSVSCTNSSTTAQYLRLRSTVYDPSNQNAPVVEDSLLSPKPRDGGAAVQIVDRNGSGVSGIPISLAQSPFSTITTDSQGCSLFGFLDTSTNYGVNFSQTGYVDPTGTGQIMNAPITQVPGSTTLTQFQYDLAGSVTVNFVTSSGTASKATSLSAFNAHIPLTPSLRTYSLGSSPGVSTATADKLFPFTDPYTFFSGSCLAEKPPATSNKLATATVGPGSTSQTVTVTEPAIKTTVQDRFGTALSGATVYITESDAGCNDAYTDTSTTGGALSNPGYPYGHFYVCASQGGRWGWYAGTVDNTADTGATVPPFRVSSSSKSGTYCP